MGALKQLLYSVKWGNIDVMVIDLPPGTGDAQLTLCQSVPLDGAVIVSTPQDLALIDVKRGINMFQKVSVPIMGIIENMSYFVCTKCGTVSNIFGHHGAKDTAEKMGVPFLGEIPLDIDIRETTDSGKPIVVSKPGSVGGKCYLNIAQNIINFLAQSRPQGPKIMIE